MSVLLGQQPLPTAIVNMDNMTDPTTMTSAPSVQPKFLPTRNELGVVAVGFSGGQVR